MGDDLQSLIERYRRAKDSRVFAPLADAYRKNGEIDKAIEVLEEGLKRHPGYASAHVILGKCYYDRGATERAKAEFERVVELDPENMVALKLLGDILVAENRRPEAAEYFRRLLVVDPTNEEVTRSLRDMEQSFVVREIDLADGKSVKDERPRELATMTLAGIYAAQGYYNKALKIYQEIIEKEPANREARDMVEKLQSMLDTTEEERGKTFREGVLTISLDDISDNMIASTAGHGGSATRDKEREAPPLDETSMGKPAESVAPPEVPAGESPTESAAEQPRVIFLGGPVEEIKETPAAETGEAPAAAERSAEAAPPPEAAEAEAGTAPPSEGSKVESGVDEDADESPTDMEHFRVWLRRLRGK